MFRKNKITIVVLVLLLVIPLIGGSTISDSANQEIWIVNSDAQDRSISYASQIINDYSSRIGYNVRVFDLNQLDSLLQQPDVLVIIGHGQRDGLSLQNGVISWSNLYDSIAEHNPKRAVILACNSPTDRARSIFGFSGQIDAEAGALLALWHISNVLDSQIEIDIPLDRIADAQMNMEYPLGSYVYFVHGYHGENSEFSNMIGTLRDDYDLDNNYDGYMFFDYLADYSSYTQAHGASIEEFADNFRDYLISNHPAGTQIDIVAHSMGGLITRQMLMADRQGLESNGIEVKRVITLATPHQGTNVAEPGLGVLFARFLDIFYDKPWISNVFSQMGPSDDFITTLNYDPLSYSTGIDWYTISAVDYIGGGFMYPVHLEANDKIVASGRAHLSFSEDVVITWCEHETLHNDPQQRSYSSVGNWLEGGIDSDGDGLLDVEEVHVYGSNPNSINSDGDAINDGTEVAWGYDPANANDPIPASSLVSSVSYTSSTRYVRVYVNHFTNMDYVKFYVKYYSSGSWTSYSYMGTDYTPYTGGDYYDSWTHPSGYTKMTIQVKAYDSSGHYLGSDYYTCGISSGGGGGGGRPPLD